MNDKLFAWGFLGFCAWVLFNSKSKVKTNPAYSGNVSTEPMSQFLKLVRSLKHPAVKEVSVSNYYKFTKGGASVAVDIDLKYVTGKEAILHIDWDGSRFAWLDFGITHNMGRTPQEALISLESLVDKEKIHKIFKKPNLSGGNKKSNPGKDFLNCRLFVQNETGISNIEAQPQIQEALVGSILWWGDKKHGYRHMAIYDGDGYVRQVEEWGARPERKLLSEVEAYWGKPDRIYSGKIK